MNKFKVGDKVRVTLNGREHTGHFDGSFINAEMLRKKTQLFVVSAKHPDHYNLKGSAWVWKECWLELATPPSMAERRAEQAALVAETEKLLDEVKASLTAARQLLVELESKIGVGDKYRHKTSRGEPVYTIEHSTDNDVCVSYLYDGKKRLAVVTRRIIENSWVHVVE